MRTFTRCPHCGEEISYAIEDGEVVLSSREWDVIDQIMKGRTNKEIAHELEISEQTVKNHMTSIFRKTGLYDRVQLAVMMRHTQAEKVAEDVEGSPVVLKPTTKIEFEKTVRGKKIGKQYLEE